MEDAARRTKVDWLPWGPRAFRIADHLDKPILLAISTPWCHWCHEMDETTYSDPGLAANLNDGFVPVRVDADRNPRVRDRYVTGGFPSTVFLTPDGTILTGAGHLDVEGLRSVLTTVRERWDSAGRDAGRVPRAVRDQSPPVGPLDSSVEQLLSGQLQASWDAEQGGWGSAEKFPLPETISFALKREPELATRALELVGAHLQQDDGLVSRHAAQDWSDRTEETLTDTTGAVLGAFADAYCLQGSDRFRVAARAAVDGLTGPMWRNGAVAASRGAPDDDGAPGKHGVDPTHFADRNATVAVGLLWYHAYTDDERAGERGLQLMEALESLTSEGLVAHYDGSGSPRGFLTDQARVLQAHVTAAQILDPSYVEEAAAVAEATLETLLAEDGCFLDAVPEGPGLLDRPLRPIDENARLADALLTLGELTEEDRYRRVARDALSAFAGAADRVGVHAAIYGTAAARTVNGPLVLAVADDVGSNLHRAALRVADNEKVVVPEAPGPSGTAWIRTTDDTRTPVETPEALQEQVSAYIE